MGCIPLFTEEGIPLFRLFKFVLLQANQKLFKTDILGCQSASESVLVCLCVYQCLCKIECVSLSISVHLYVCIPLCPCTLISRFVYAHICAH